jgi:ABC-type uncharacterized transport system permease subunit
MTDEDLIRQRDAHFSVEPQAPIQLPPDMEPKGAVSVWVNYGIQAGTPIVAAFLALVVGGVIMWLAGYDPVLAYAALFQGALGGPRQIGETIMRSTPLIFTGLAVAFAFRAGLFNIGAEGQLFIGGLVAASVGLVLGAVLPGWIAVPVLLTLCAAGGAAWAFIPAILKARVGAHEVITTMMFSYIARYLVSWVAIGPLKAPGPIPQTPQLPAGALIQRVQETFPFLTTGRAHFGFLLAIVLAVAIWAFFKWAVLGYEARAVGYNPDAAENAGISVSRTTVFALCASGALAGLAGAVEVMGVQGKLFDQFSSGAGFTGIAVALLAKNNPLGVIPAALLFGALSAGAGMMQLEAGVPQKIISIIQALVILFVASEGVIRVWIKRREKKRTEALETAAGGANA